MTRGGNAEKMTYIWLIYYDWLTSHHRLCRIVFDCVCWSNKAGSMYLHHVLLRNICDVLPCWRLRNSTFVLCPVQGKCLANLNYHQDTKIEHFYLPRPGHTWHRHWSNFHRRLNNDDWSIAHRTLGPYNACRILYRPFSYSRVLWYLQKSF